MNGTLLSKSCGLLLIAGTASGLQGCDAGDLALGIGLIAIGAGVVAVGAGSDGDSCHGGYREECHEYRDRWGRWQRDCRQVYDSCDHYDRGGHRGGHRAVIKPLHDLPTDIKVDDVLESKWAAGFQMSHAASIEFLSALEHARDNKDLTDLKNLGLSNQDITNLSKLEMITSEGLEALSVNLNQDRVATQQMLERILIQARIAKQANS